MNKVVAFLVACFLCGQALLAQQWYVAPNGNDNDPGTLQQPFATLNRAKAAVRQFKKQKTNLESGLTVFIRGGEYSLSSTFELQKEDGGQEGAPVVYKAYANEVPHFSAATTVNAKQWKSLGKDARKRLHPKVDAAKLVALDIRQLRLNNAFQFAPGNSFTTEWYIVDLFANGSRQPIAQYPNPTQNIRGKNDPGWITCNGTKNQATFYFGANGLPDDKDTTNELDIDGTQRSERWLRALQSGHEVWLKGLWRVPWEPFTIKVADINLQDQSIQLSVPPPSGMGSKYSAVANEQPLWRKGSGKEGYFAINLLEEIDKPGEWALDIQDQKIYYYPPAAIESLQIAINDFNNALIKINGASHITVQGLQLDGTLGSAIEMNQCTQVLVANCQISNVGKTGIAMQGGNSNTLQANNIFETGGVGIELKNLGDRKTLLSSNVVVDNNHVHHVGKLIYKQAISLSNSVGVTIRHNLLHDIPTGSIRTDNINNCLFEYNEIHNIALKEGDTGVFYSYGGWSTYGNIFRYNFSHHTSRANAFYSDDGDSGDFYYKNIVHDCIGGVLVGGGHDVLAENNLFVQSKKQTIDDRGKDRNYRLGTKYESALRQFNVDKSPWKEYGEALKNQHQLSTNLWGDVLQLEWHPELPNGSRMQNNVAVASGKFQSRSGNVVVANNDVVKTIAEAQFFDYAQMDLRTNNSVILAKFPELNQVFVQIGLQKDAYRTQIPTRAATGGLLNRINAENIDTEDKMVDKVKPTKP